MSNIVKFPAQRQPPRHTPKSRDDQRMARPKSERRKLRHLKQRRPTSSPCPALERKRIRRSTTGSFAAVRCVTMFGTISFGAIVVGKMHTAGLKGEPLATIEPEIRREWLEALDRAIGALGTVAAVLTQAVNTLKALQSETSDFPVKLPVPDSGTTCPKFSKGGQSVLRLARCRLYSLVVNRLVD